jgi:tripartite-type tricarboxylate transporter receptor subunit TctC
MRAVIEPGVRRLTAPALTAAILVGLMSSTPALAQDRQDPFYKTNKLTLGASSGVGGSYDAYMRLLGRHLARHIPGTPSIVVQNVPAGGGMALANMIYNTAPKDGSYIGVLHGTTLQEEVIGSAAVRFDGRRFAWIGNMMSDVDTCVVSAASGVKSADDFFTREVVVGATGAGAQSFSFPTIYNEILGARFKVIAGYPGTPERVLAMERGELQGACGITTTSFASILERPAREGKVILVAQAGGRKDAAYPNVPNMLDFAKTAADREAMLFVFAPLDLGRPIAAPPETPPERLAILRRAFDAVTKDPELLEEAAKLKMKIDPADAGRTADMVDRLFATPKAIVERIAAALAAKSK